MSKINVIIVIGVIIILILSGVLEVKFHPDKLKDVPVFLEKVIPKGAAMEKIRVGAVRLKRRGEEYIIKDRDRQLEVKLGYISTDAVRLQDALLSDKPLSEAIVPQGQLVVDDLKEVTRRAESTSLNKIEELKDISAKAFKDADEVYKILKKRVGEEEGVSPRIKELLTALEDQLKAFNLARGPSSDSAVPIITTFPTSVPSAVPLKF